MWSERTPRSFAVLFSFVRLDLPANLHSQLFFSALPSQLKRRFRSPKTKSFVNAPLRAEYGTIDDSHAVKSKWVLAYHAHNRLWRRFSVDERPFNQRKKISFCNLLIRTEIIYSVSEERRSFYIYLIEWWLVVIGLLCYRINRRGILIWVQKAI